MYQQAFILQRRQLKQKLQQIKIMNLFFLQIRNRLGRYAEDSH